MKLAILVSGRGSNMKAILDNKRAGRLKNVEPVICVSNIADAPALKIAEEYGLEALYIDPKPYKGKRGEYDKLIASELKKRGVDFIALAGFMRIITKGLIQEFPHRIINIHPALLPSFPGLHGQKQALDYGVKISGCTVHFVDEGVDTGPVIIQAAVPVLDSDTEDTLSARILKFEHRLYSDALELVSDGKVKIEGRRVFINDDNTQEENK